MSDILITHVFENDKDVFANVVLVDKENFTAQVKKCRLVDVPHDIKRPNKLGDNKPVLIAYNRHDNTFLAVNKNGNMVIAQGAISFDNAELVEYPEVGKTSVRVAEHIQLMGQSASRPEDRTAYIESWVTATLIKLGVPAHIRGYRFTREAIMRIANDKNLLNHITTKLYPDIASADNTTPSRVERAIRHAIVATWKRGEADTRSKLFASAKPPTNSEFIARIADKLRMQLMGIDESF